MIRIDELRSEIAEGERPLVAAATLIGAMMDLIIARHGEEAARTLMTAICREMDRRAGAAPSPTDI